MDFIPCDYCDAPALGVVYIGRHFHGPGPDWDRRFRCGHEDHKHFARFRVPRMPARSDHCELNEDELMDRLREQHVRLRLSPIWLTVAATRARVARRHAREREGQR